MLQTLLASLPERTARTLRSDSKTAAVLLLLRQQQIALGDMISGAWLNVKIWKVAACGCECWIQLNKLCWRVATLLECLLSFDADFLQLSVCQGACLKCFTADIEDRVMHKLEVRPSHLTLDV